MSLQDKVYAIGGLSNVKNKVETFDLSCSRWTGFEDVPGQFVCAGGFMHASQLHLVANGLLIYQPTKKGWELGPFQNFSNTAFLTHPRLITPISDHAFLFCNDHHLYLFDFLAKKIRWLLTTKEKPVSIKVVGSAVEVVDDLLNMYGLDLADSKRSFLAPG